MACLMAGAGMAAGGFSSSHLSSRSAFSSQSNALVGAFSTTAVSSVPRCLAARAAGTKFRVRITVLEDFVFESGDYSSLLCDIRAFYYYEDCILSLCCN